MIKRGQESCILIYTFWYLWFKSFLSLIIIIELFLKNDKMMILIITLLFVMFKIGHCHIEGRQDIQQHID